MSADARSWLRFPDRGISGSTIVFDFDDNDWTVSGFEFQAFGRNHLLQPAAP
jgi:hypothetical protein